MEVGVLVDKLGRPIYWHEPQGSSSVYLPDSRDLWDMIWENREDVSGFAHSHPGRGMPMPSHEDLTTFEAVEAALGRRLTWWITSENQLTRLEWYEDQYNLEVWGSAPSWLDELRKRSYRREEVSKSIELGSRSGE